MMKRQIILLLLAVVLLIGLAGFIGSGRRLAGQATAWSFGRCDPEWYDRQAALVVACVGQDMTRIWPLPLITPWVED